MEFHEASRPAAFTSFTVLVELSLVPLAWTLGKFWPHEGPVSEWNLQEAGFGLLGAVPPLVFLLWVASPRWRNVRFLREIRRRLREAAGPTLAELKAPQMVLIGLAAGLGEEVLFRGWAQPRLGLLVTVAFFGLLHAMTPAYAVLAGLLGAYLGWLLEARGNLLVPILVHAIYDTAALFVVRRQMREPPEGDGEEGDQKPTDAPG